MITSSAAVAAVVAEVEAVLGPVGRLVNAAALDNWAGGSGLVRLDYRWRIAHRILADIFDGLGVTA